MKKKFGIALLILFVIAIIFCWIYLKWSNKELLNLPEGEKLFTVVSPNKEMKLNMYFINGGSLSADSIRGEIVSKDRKYNIYYCYRDCDFAVDVKWLDNNHVKINGVKLSLDDKYRKE